MKRITETVLAAIILIALQIGAVSAERIRIPVTEEKQRTQSREIYEDAQIELFSGSNTSENIIIRLPAATAPANSFFTIKGIEAYAEDVYAVDEFFSDYCYRDSVCVFEKAGEKSYLLWDNVLYNDYGSDKYCLDVPVPEGLEIGSYNVSIHPLYDPYLDYNSVVFCFTLSITDAEGDAGVVLHDTRELLSEKMLAFCGDVRFSVEEPFDEGDHIRGFAIGDDGTIYELSAEYNEGYIDCWSDEFHSGNYECYFYYDGILYGPAECEMSNVDFYDDVFVETAATEYICLDVGYMLADKLRNEIENRYDCTLTITLSDMNENKVAEYEKITPDSISSSFDTIDSYNEISFFGLGKGQYYANVVLEAEGRSYRLGRDIITITDETWINFLSLAGRYNLTPATESFFMDAITPGIFTDYDKIDIRVVDEDGIVYAETVNSGLEHIQENAYVDYPVTMTFMYYEFDVIKPFDEHGRYYLEIEKNGSLTTHYSRCISVRDSPEVLKCEFDYETGVVTVYIENIESGEYKAIIYDDNDEEKEYTVNIDENGKGVFKTECAGEIDCEFTLYTLDGEYIKSCWPEALEYFPGIEWNPYTQTQPIVKDATFVEKYCVDAVYFYDKSPDINDIEKVIVSQNGEEIAEMKDMCYDGWTNDEHGLTYISFYGRLEAVNGKSFAGGTAVLEIRYKNGRVCKEIIEILDESSDLYGNIKLKNSKEFKEDFYMTSDEKVMFSIENTNLVTGVLELYKDYEIIEELKIEELDKIKYADGLCSYFGAFDTPLEKDTIYSICIEAEYGYLDCDFMICSTAYAKTDRYITAYGGEAEVVLYDSIGIENLYDITVKAVSGDDEYEIPSQMRFGESEVPVISADLSGLPEGRCEIRLYNRETRIQTLSKILCSNKINVLSPVVAEADWSWNRDSERELRIYGKNLDKVKDMSVQIYKMVYFPLKNAYGDSFVLELTGEKELSGSFDGESIILNADFIRELAEGCYLFVYNIDGSKAIDEIFIAEGEENDDITLIAALYSADGSLVDVNICDNEDDISFEGDGEYAKLMHWDIDTMIPFGNAEFITKK